MRMWRSEQCIAVTSGTALGAADPMDAYNVVWRSPSEDCNGSMPIGNGEMGLNVWVEPGGDLVFYCGRTDSWDENMRLCKLGRVRIQFTPSLAAGEFTQELRLRQGEIAIQGGPAGSRIVVRVWPDANRQVAYVEAESAEDFQMRVVLEVWRDRETIYDSEDAAQTLFPPTSARYPDTVLPGQADRIVWHHRNPVSPWGFTLELQGLKPAMVLGKDPLLHRTFGGLIQGKGLVRVDDRTLKTVVSGKRFRVAMHTHTMVPATEAEWLAAIERNAEEVTATGIAKARTAHRRWWDRFWNRSWIRATGTPEAEAATQAYVLQRFINASGGRGHFPVKFNGSIFTVDSVFKGRTRDPDFRLWGGCYWFQNTRLIYWPMLASGDFELMRPLFRMYADALPLARARSQIYFGHEGVFFPETMTFYGCYDNGDFGWGGRTTGRPGDPIANDYVRHHYNGTLELLALMLDYQAYTQDREFLRDELLPMADEVLAWWDKHWPRDAAGKLRVQPAHALETYWNVANPAPDMAGLVWDLNRLLALSDREIGIERRARWSALRQAVPALPTMTRENKTVLAPYETTVESPRSNSENPELYAIFPFRLYGVGKPDLDLAIDTFNDRHQKSNVGWQQDDTQAAFLGLTALARDGVVSRTANKHPESRFPAFWGPNYDWVPDQDNGGNLLMTLQTMLVQADDGKVRLLPAWPKQWNVEFKLHVPGNTTLEGVCLDGKLVTLSGTPRKRAKDVITSAPQ